MKTTNLSKRVLTFLIFVNFAITTFGIDVLIRRDTQSDPPGVNFLSSAKVTSYASSSTSYDVPVYAFTNENTLTLNFEILVRKVNIEVFDQNNMMVYSRQISTYSQSSLDIDMSAWESGNYTIKINYGTTNLVGEFTLE